MNLTQSYAQGDNSRPLLETTVGSALRATAARVPEMDALVVGAPDPAMRQRWTYRELLIDSERTAQALLSHFQPGDHVAVWANNIPEWILLEYGAALAGLVLVTVNPAYQPKELAYVLTQSRAAGLFYVSNFRGNDMAAAVSTVRSDCPHLRHTIDFAEWDAFLEIGGDRELPLVSPNDAVQIQYTSGTTGFPKGAVLHHLGVTNNARLVAERCGIQSGHKWVACMPLFHCGGCVAAVLGTVQVPGTVVLVHRFDPGLILELIESERANFISGVPTMVVALEEHPDFVTRDLSSLRGFMMGGSTVPVDMVRRLEGDFGIATTIVYGQTETSPISIQTSLDDSPKDKSETLGTTMPHTEIKIVDPETGDILPIGEVGEFCTRGYLVMHEYFDMPERTAETIDADGWLHSGDLCAMDTRGYVTIEGRLKDMIIRGGENIYPREIEELLFAHPAVADIAVVGLPDPRWGELVGAFVRLEAGTSVDSGSLVDYLRQSLAAYKTPKVWVRMEEFPLTGSGKVRKFALREMWERGEVQINM